MKMKKLFILMLVMMILSLTGAECVFGQEYISDVSPDGEAIPEESFSDDPSAGEAMPEETVSEEIVTERIQVDGSSLTAGEPFVFTITVNSDENLSFSDAQTRLSALLCPVGESADECMTMNMVPDSENDVTMRVTFEMEELPLAGDYKLDVRFSDETGTFADQSASYLITNVQEGAALEIPVTVKKVTMQPALLDEEGSTLLYNSVLYVGESYTLRLTADSAMNDSVSVNAALPESIRNAPIAPDSECMQFLNEERTALTIPGSRWNAEGGNVFSCGISFTESTWVTAQPITFSILPTGRQAAETFEMDPLNWSFYPVNITKHPATHQLQISDSRGNLLCSDTVPCGMFNEAESYILTYRFPAEWDHALPGGKNFTAELSWPADWADALRQTLNRDLAAQYGTACTVDEEGHSDLTLTETAEGRYQVSCVFSPAGLTSPAVNPVTLHLNDNSWTVTDLKVSLPSVVIPAAEIPTPVPTAVPTETPTAVPTEVLTEVPTEVPMEETSEAEDLLIGAVDLTETPLPGDDITETETETVPTEEVLTGDGRKLRSK